MNRRSLSLMEESKFKSYVMEKTRTQNMREALLYFASNKASMQGDLRAFEESLQLKKGFCTRKLQNYLGDTGYFPEIDRYKKFLDAEIRAHDVKDSDASRIQNFVIGNMQTFISVNGNQYGVLQKLNLRNIVA